MGCAVPGMGQAILGVASFGWGSGALGGGLTIWQEVHAQVVRSVVDIGLDTKKLEIELGAHPQDNDIEWSGELTLPVGTTLNPPAEAVQIHLASPGGVAFDTTIPAGSFLAHPDGSFRFKSGERTSPEMAMRLKPRGGALWDFKIDIEDVMLGVVDRTQVTTTLQIGNKLGTQTLPLLDKGKQLVFEKKKG